jgi:hypothetical protein
VAEIGHFEFPESAWLGWRATACLAGSHEIETLSGEEIYSRRESLTIFAFLARTFSAEKIHHISVRLRGPIRCQGEVPLCMTSGSSAKILRLHGLVAA